MRSFRNRKPLPITFEKMFMRAGFRMTKINVNFRHPEPCSHEHFSNMFLNFLARTIARLSEHPRNNISADQAVSRVHYDSNLRVHILYRFLYKTAPIALTIGNFSPLSALSTIISRYRQPRIRKKHHSAPLSHNFPYPRQHPPTSTNSRNVNNPHRR